MYEIRGIHHVTGMTSRAETAYRFFTEILGLRLIKRTLNYDDIQTYHLYFADDIGTPGTDIDFFDFPDQGPAVLGNNQVRMATFRVRSDEAIDFWQERFAELGIVTAAPYLFFGKKVLPFEDGDGAEYLLISDEWDAGEAGGRPWAESPVPPEYGIIGLGPVIMKVADGRLLDLVLRDVLAFEMTAQEGNYLYYEVDEGGNGASLIVEESDEETGESGYGSIHHIALRVDDEESLDFWIERIRHFEIQVTDPVDRLYFKSAYFGASPGIMLELSTDGPGFFVDEPYETSGTTLKLPPFLEEQREFVERMIRPLQLGDE